MIASPRSEENVMTDIEVRYVDIDLRAEAGSRVVSGIVAPYGVRSRIAGWFDEEFQPGAFGAVDRADVIVNVQHDRRMPVARTGAGLTLTDGAEALRMSAEIAPTRAGDDVLEAVRAKLYRGLSVEMRVNKEDWTEEAGKVPVRVIRAADIRGIGIVDRPAHDSAGIDARAREVYDSRAWGVTTPPIKRKRARWL